MDGDAEPTAPPSETAGEFLLSLLQSKPKNQNNNPLTIASPPGSDHQSIAFDQAITYVSPTVNIFPPSISPSRSTMHTLPWQHMKTPQSVDSNGLRFPGTSQHSITQPPTQSYKRMISFGSVTEDEVQMIHNGGILKHEHHKIIYPQATDSNFFHPQNQEHRGGYNSRGFKSTPPHPRFLSNQGGRDRDLQNKSVEVDRLRRLSIHGESRFNLSQHSVSAANAEYPNKEACGECSHGDDENEDKAKDEKKNSRENDSRMDNRGEWLLSQRLRTIKRTIPCRTDIHMYDAPFMAIYKSLIPSEDELEKQKQLMARLENLVNKEWSINAKLYLYGSCANSFGFRKSDIDVCLAIKDNDFDKSEVLLKMSEILQSDDFQNVQALPRARVPIVKFKDPVTGISCDMCINNVLAVINTKLLLDYARIDVRLRQLAFIVKYWAKSRKVNETYRGTLSSYAYVLMCIHFLQHRRPPILPCLQEMDPTYSVTVDNIRCSYFDNVDRLSNFGSSNRETIAELVWGFFSYWAYGHDYANSVASVRTGSILGKREKDWTRRVGNDRHLICIEDPFETSHDLGRVVDKFSIRVLREEFERAAMVMHHDPNPCVKLFEPYLPEDNDGQSHTQTFKN